MMQIVTEQLFCDHIAKGCILPTFVIDESSQPPTVLDEWFTVAWQTTLDPRILTSLQRVRHTLVIVEAH